MKEEAAMDDLDPPQRDPLFAAPSNDELNRLSLHELKERVAFLKAEITRTQEVMKSKQGAQSEAESFFKK